MRFGTSHRVLQDIRDLDAVIADTADAELRGADAVTVRVAAAVWDLLCAEGPGGAEVIRDRARALAARRASMRIVALPDVASFVERHDNRRPALLSPLELLSGDQLWPVRQLAIQEEQALQQSELSGIISSAGNRCILLPPAGRHFHLPSGAHATHFLRFAEVLNSIAAVDSVAYWIARVAASVTGGLNAGPTRPVALIGDCSGMLGPLLRAASVMTQPTRVGFLEEYPLGYASVESTRRQVAAAADASCAVIFVIGVASTGRMASLLGTLAKPYAAFVKVLVVFALTEAVSEGALCKVSIAGYAHSSDGAGCGICSTGGGEAVRIDSSTYMLPVSKPQPVAIERTNFDGQKDFISRFGAFPGVLRTHYDDPNEAVGRHHAYYVDVDSLLRVDMFCRELVERFRDVGSKASVIVGPRHQTAQRLGQLLSDAFEVPFLALDYADAIGTHEDKQLRAGKRILVIDDVLISGRQLRALNERIRMVVKGGPTPEAVDFRVCVGLVESELRQLEIERGLTTSNPWFSSFMCGWSICTPQWHERKTCPWCTETQLLERILAFEDNSDIDLDRRLSELRATQVGLSDRVFDTHSSEVRVPSFGAGSTIFPEGWSPIQIAFAVASAVQQKRVSRSAPLGYADNYDLRQVARRVLEKNFTERVAWLAFLRGLRHTEMSDELRAFLRDQALPAASTSVLPDYAVREFAVSLLTGTFGAVADDEATQQFLRRAGIPPDLVRKAGLFSGTPDGAAPRQPSISRFRRSWYSIKQWIAAGLDALLGR